MRVHENEQIVFCDVDDTIVVWNAETLGDTPPPKTISVIDPFSGKTLYLKPHEPHIILLREKKARGAEIVVLSHGGFLWAATVIKALGLENIVDDVYTKPCLILDDQPIESALGRTTYLKPDSAWKRGDEFL